MTLLPYNPITGTITLYEDDMDQYLQNYYLVTIWIFRSDPSSGL